MFFKYDELAMLRILYCILIWIWTAYPYMDLWMNLERGSHRSFPIPKEMIEIGYVCNLTWSDCYVFRACFRTFPSPSYSVFLTHCFLAVRKGCVFWGYSWYVFTPPVSTNDNKGDWIKWQDMNGSNSIAVLFKRT